jgi:hypothetical protein
MGARSSYLRQFNSGVAFAARAGTILKRVGKMSVVIAHITTEADENPGLSGACA